MSEAAARRSTTVHTSVHEAAAPQISTSPWKAPGAATIVRPRPGGKTRQAIYVLIDLVLVCVGAITVYWVRFGAPQMAYEVWGGTWSRLQILPLHGYPGFLVLYAALIVLACTAQDLYRTPREMSSIAETLSVSKAIGLATTVLVLFFFISGNKEISRLVVIFSGLVNIVTFSGWRHAKRKYVSRRLRQGIGTRRALIVGAGKMGHELAACFEQNYELGYEVCGFLDVHPNGDPRVLGSIADFRRVALGQFADEVFVTPPIDREMVRQILVEARNLRLPLEVVPDLYDGLGRYVAIRTIGGFPALVIHDQPIPTLGLAIKRLIDIVLSALGLVLSGPVMAAAAIWIRLDSPGPVLYSAFRVGRKGHRFRCYKLRTMILEADMEKAKLRHFNGRNGPFFKMDNDPRITRSGRWLRRYSIDELPQLVNVLLGEMSLVGPRPHPVDDYERYSLEHLRRLDVKPGLTGLWQVTARRDPSFETNMALDLEYIEGWSLWLDLKILARTIPAALRAEGN